MTSSADKPVSDKDSAAHFRRSETARQERAQGGQPQLSGSGDPNGADAGHPEDREGAAKATADNDLTTGHSAPDDGGGDNAKR